MSDQEMPGPEDPREGRDPREGQDPADVGSVGEEAAKLFGAVSDWARDQGADAGQGLAGQGLGGLVGQAAAAMQGINEHIATGSPECTYCPICRTVHTIRQTSPEVRAHLATAASSFLQAAAALLAGQAPKDDPGRGSSVERIDLDDDADEDRTDGRAPGER